MTYTDRLYVIKTTIVLFFLSLSALIFEALSARNLPQVETHKIGYITFGTGLLSFLVTLVVYLFGAYKANKNTSNQNTNSTVKQSIIQNLMDEFKAASMDCVSLQYQINANKIDEENLKKLKSTLKIRKHKISEIFNKIKQNSQEGQALFLLTKFTSAYIKNLESIESQEKLNRDFTTSKLKLLEISESKGKVLNSIALKLHPKADPFFDITLDH